jgi:hypothetical protein
VKELDANASGNTDSKDNINISLDSVDFSFLTDFLTDY